MMEKGYTVYMRSFFFSTLKLIKLFLKIFKLRHCGLELCIFTYTAIVRLMSHLFLEMIHAWEPFLISLH